MISEKQLKEEIKNTKAFIKYLVKKSKKHDSDERFITEAHMYLDGLLYCLNGKLD
jgi:hypothetical protein